MNHLPPQGSAGESSHRSHQAMGPGREFDTIRMLMDRWRDLAVGIGDDAALLPHVGERQRVVSVDACIEGAHFLREWLTPREIGARGVAAALSDLAAMGAHADALLLAFAVPDSWRAELGDIADGIAEVVRPTGAKIIGGNLSRSERFSMTTTVVGSTSCAVSRRGAVPGDLLVVTGRLGGPGAAIRAWYDQRAPSSWARARFVGPMPRLAEGQALAAAGAHAMLDISDGLVADARHMAAASQVRLQIDARLVPLGDGITVAEALNSGEEYELLAAIEPTALAALLGSWGERLYVPLTVIGAVVDHDRDGTVNVADVDKFPGTKSAPRVELFSGHDHFTG